jgi:hypothetical protein
VVASEFIDRDIPTSGLPLPRGKVSQLITQRLLADCNKIVVHVNKVNSQF